jgi:hypothetical protein
LSDDGADALQMFRDALLGLPVSHFWRGYGSTIFLEFGRLTPRIRRSGKVGNPRGELGLMIGWSWRIENAVSILCGSWSDEPLWEPTFDLLRNKAVEKLSVVGRLPEIAVGLTEDLHLSSFMTAEGDPKWCLFDRRSDPVTWLCVRDGVLTVEIAEKPTRPLLRIV